MWDAIDFKWNDKEDDEEKIKGYIEYWEKERQENLKNNNIARAVGCELLIKDLKRRLGEELEED